MFLRMYDVIWTENNRVSSTRKREANLQWRSYRDRSESALPGPNSQSSVDRKGLRVLLLVRGAQSDSRERVAQC